jgi:LuxR family maltose regulon positive regulatory protein
MAENTTLTPRQRETLSWLATWLTSAEIGARMGISLHTVKSHSYAVYRKLGVPDRRTAVARGRELGLIGPSGTAPGDVLP